MKTKYLLHLALIAIVSFSCGKEAVFSDDSNQVNLEERLNIELSEDTNISESFRFTHAVNSSTGILSGLRLQEKDLRVRLAFRRGSTIVVHPSEVTFKKVPGTNKFTYSGKFTPIQGTGDHYVAALIVAEVSGRTFLNSLTSTTYSNIQRQGTLLQASNNQLDTRMPYIAKWTKVGNSTNNKTTLVFKPSGILVRYRFVNDASTKETIRVTKFTFSSRAAFPIWGYDFTKLDKENGSNMLEGYRSNLSPMTTDFNMDYTLAAGQSTPWLYFWVMPVAHSPNSQEYGGVTTYYATTTSWSKRPLIEETILHRKPNKLGAMEIQQTASVSSFGGASEGRP